MKLSFKSGTERLRQSSFGMVPFISLQHITVHGKHSYVVVQVQFEGALNELELLKQQHADKISQLSKENETFRNLYKKSEAMTQQYQAEIHVIKLRNVELVAAQKQLQEAIVQVRVYRRDLLNVSFTSFFPSLLTIFLGNKFFSYICLSSIFFN